MLVLLWSSIPLMVDDQAWKLSLLLGQRMSTLK